MRVGRTFFGTSGSRILMNGNSGLAYFNVGNTSPLLILEKNTTDDNTDYSYMVGIKERCFIKMLPALPCSVLKLSTDWDNETIHEDRSIEKMWVIGWPFVWQTRISSVFHTFTTLQPSSYRLLVNLTMWTFCVCINLDEFLLLSTQAYSTKIVLSDFWF